MSLNWLLLDDSLLRTGWISSWFHPRLPPYSWGVFPCYCCFVFVTGDLNLKCGEACHYTNYIQLQCNQNCMFERLGKPIILPFPYYNSEKNKWIEFQNVIQTWFKCFFFFFFCSLALVLQLMLLQNWLQSVAPRNFFELCLLFVCLYNDPHHIFIFGGFLYFSCGFTILWFVT